MTDRIKAEKAEVAASTAHIKAEAAHQAAVDAQKTPEQLRAEDLAQKADDLTSKAMELAATPDSAVPPMTATEAGVLAVLPADMMASDHRAQKFGNDPANPRPAPGVDMTKGPMVKLKIQKPEAEADTFCEVPEKMVGDYERAGWNRV